MRDQYHDDLDAITDRRWSTSPAWPAARSTAPRTALLDADLPWPSRRHLRRRRDRRALRADRGARPRPARPPAAGRATCASSSPACAWSPTSSAWATSRCTSPRSPAAATRPARSRASCSSTVLEMGQVAQQIVAKCSQRHRRPRPRAGRRARARRRRHGRPAPQSCSPGCCSDERRTAVETAIDVTLCGRYYERFCRPRRLGRPPGRLPRDRRAHRRRRRRGLTDRSLVRARAAASPAASSPSGTPAAR